MNSKSILLAGSIILTFLLSLLDLELGLAFFGLIVGWILYQKNPLWHLLIIPSTIIFGEIISVVVLGYNYEITLTEVAIISLGIYFLLDTVLKKSWKNIQISSIGFLLFLYFVLHIIAILWVWDISRTLIAIRTISYHILFFLLTINILKTQKDLTKAIWGAPIAGLAIAMQLLWTVVSLGGLTSVIDRQQIITTAGPWVTISAMIFMNLPFAYMLLLQVKTKRAKQIIGAIITTCIVAGFLALGKAEIGALTIGTYFFLKKSKQWKKSYRMPITIVLILLIISPFRNYIFAFWERIVSTFETDSVSFRLEEWKVGIEGLKESLFLGVGAGNLKVLFQMKHPCHCDTEANNIILHMLVEFGLVGISLAGMFILDIWKRLKNLKNTQTRLMQVTFQTSLLILAIISMAEVTFISLNFGTLFWYIIALLVVASEKTYTSKKV